MKKQKGFTLIELLVVIAIIGILASVVIASLGSARSKASDSKIKAQLKSMQAQVELYTGTGVARGGIACPTAVLNEGQVAAFANTIFERGNGGIGSFFDGLPEDGRSYCGSLAGKPVDGSAWFVAYRLADNSYWCVDGAKVVKSYPADKIFNDVATLSATTAQCK